MHLLFLYGPPASGKYTIARIIAEQTGLPLFHNHLIVDAVAAVFPFGSANFIRLREQFWLETLSAAIEDDRSLIFTFA
ncbi:MAG: shikimate kinase, partial [Pseudomonadota bacterium]